MGFVGWEDSSILEAASWRLASEIVRRHPTTTHVIRAHPGGGQYDLLRILPKPAGLGEIALNRNGTIQILGRFDGQEACWPPTDWDDYFRSEPHSFLLRLEDAAGLPQPPSVPKATARTLTLRVLAAIAATAVKSVHPIEMEPGYIDTSGYGGGPNREAFELFPQIPANLVTPQTGDFLDEPGYRFWFVHRDGTPIMAFEQNLGMAWGRTDPAVVNVMEVYVKSGRDVVVTAAELFRRLGTV